MRKAKNTPTQQWRAGQDGTTTSLKRKARTSAVPSLTRNDVERLRKRGGVKVITTASGNRAHLAIYIDRDKIRPRD